MAGRISRWAVFAIVLIGLAGGGIYAWNYFSVRETTDDAQIDGDIFPVGARVGGTVLEVLAKTNREVEKGAILARLDSREFEIAVHRAEAELADAEAAAAAARVGVPLTATSSASQTGSAHAAIARAQAGVESAARELDAQRTRVRVAQSRVGEQEAHLIRANRDLDRMRQLIAKDEISQQQFDASVSAADAARAAVETARAAVVEAEAGVAAAEARWKQSQTVVGQAQADAEVTTTGPQQVAITRSKAASAEARVLFARAALEQARLNLEYTAVNAPAAGVVSRKSIEPGQIVQPGQMLMAIVPHDNVWITANFKETQLAKMRPGQQSEVSVDAYGGKTLRARVDSFASATGSRFSLLPPENASGNYVKVVQRIPVKIVLEDGQDPEHVLRPGMSVIVTVHTH